MSNTYIISYDLHNPGQNYETLLKRIKAYNGWAKLGGSAYVIISDDNAVTIRDNLTEILDSNDVIFVGRLNAPAAWYGMSDEVSDWLSNNLE